MEKEVIEHSGGDKLKEYQKEYRKKHKEYFKKYNKEHKEQFKKNSRKYYLKTADERRKRARLYYKKNARRILDRQKIHHSNYSKEYYWKNRELIRRKQWIRYRIRKLGLPKKYIKDMRLWEVVKEKYREYLKKKRRESEEMARVRRRRYYKKNAKGILEQQKEWRSKKIIIVIKEFKSLTEIIRNGNFLNEGKQRKIARVIKHFCKCTQIGYKDFLEELFETTGQRIEMTTFKSMLSKNIILKKYRRCLAKYMSEIIPDIRIIKFANLNICYKNFEWLREEVGSEYFKFEQEDFVKGTKEIKKVSEFIKFLVNKGYTCSDIFIRSENDIYETAIPSNWMIKVGVEFDYLGNYKVANLMDIQELEENNYAYLIKKLKEVDNGNIRQWK